MLELHHFGPSTCSQKVRLVLAHKGLDFNSVEIDLISGGQHAAEYVKMNPNHVGPTLVHGSSVLIESTLINEYLEDAFPDIPMRSADPIARHRARLWTQKLDQGVHAATGVVTFAIGPRSLLLQQPQEIREANINAIPDPARRKARRSVIENGVKAAEFSGALKAMLNLLDAVDTALLSGDWLSGEAFGLSDAAILPYVLRLDHLAMSPLLEARKNLSQWYARVQQLPAYESAINSWLPPPFVAMLQNNGSAVWQEVESILEQS
jgi:glutathione S-transferase